MITIFHGTDYLSSRKSFIDLKEKTLNYFYSDLENLSIEELLNSLSGASLFQKKQIIFLENLFTKKKGAELSEIENILNKYAGQSEVYIWEPKEISLKTIKLPKVRDQNFKLPSHIFQFLDSLKPNSPQNVTLAAKVLENTSEEVLFYMIIRQFRILFAILDPNKSIDEVKRLAPWQRSKFERQAKLFGKEKLRKVYDKIFQIEKGIKTGELSYPLRSAIDFLILEI